jgi:tRNA(adenine34) deaminase
MCAGALHAARVDRCVYGAVDPKAGALGTLYDIASDERLNHRYEVTAGVLADESSALLKSFFAALRARGRAEEPLEG